MDHFGALSAARVYGAMFGELARRPAEAPEILRLSRFIAEISLRTGSPRQWHRPDATITNGGVIFGAFLVACGTWVGWGAGRRGGGGKGGCSRPKS